MSRKNDKYKNFFSLPNLTYTQRLRLVFKGLDSLGRGFLAADEFCLGSSLCSHVGVTVQTRQSAYRIFSELDVDGIGRIEPQQFYMQLTKHSRNITSASCLVDSQTAWRVYGIGNSSQKFFRRRSKFLRDQRTVGMFETCLPFFEARTKLKNFHVDRPYLSHTENTRLCDASLLMSNIGSLRACAAVTLHRLGWPAPLADIPTPQIAYLETHVKLKSHLRSCRTDVEYKRKRQDCPQYKLHKARQKFKTMELCDVGMEFHSSRHPANSRAQESGMMQLWVAQDAYTASYRAHQHLLQHAQANTLGAMKEKNNDSETRRMDIIKKLAVALEINSKGCVKDECENNVLLSRALLEQRLDTLSSELARASLLNARYEVKLNAYRSLDSHILTRFTAALKSNSRDETTARVLAATAYINFLRRQNSSLKLELARVKHLETDLNKIKEVMRAIHAGSDLHMPTLKIGTSATVLAKTTGVFDTLQDKVMWLLARQHHLQYNIDQVGTEIDALPLFIARMGSLQGKLEATHDALEAHACKHKFLIQQLNRKFAEELAAAHDFTPSRNNGNNVLVAGLGEACDELKILTGQLSVQTKRARVANTLGRS